MSSSRRINSPRLTSTHCHTHNSFLHVAEDAQHGGTAVVEIDVALGELGLLVPEAAEALLGDVTVEHAKGSVLSGDNQRSGYACCQVTTVACCQVTTVR